MKMVETKTNDSKELQSVQEILDVEDVDDLEEVDSVSCNSASRIRNDLGDQITVVEPQILY